MGSDRARISFDSTRDYRMVIAQQGRVTLEADINEQTTLMSEALRLETIDMVGPAGTPDHGYQVSIDSNGQFAVGPGIMYVGGWRLQLAVPGVELGNQPDWLDQPPAPAAEGQREALVALLVIEQSVSAVEDQALREVALGGPDTAARMRLMQHFVQIPTRATTCADAAQAFAQTLGGVGLALDPHTLALTFTAQLKVSFYPPTAPADPCCPPAQGGYLGADNQLVRVTVLDYDPTTNTGNLLWGWNNASFLYRASLVDPSANPQILTLSPAPVDTAHMPKAGLVVEVLRTTSVLGDADDQNYIAAPEGEVVTLAGGTVFDPDSNQLTLPTNTTLPSSYQADKNPLFVRLWQAQVEFTNAQPAQLDTVSGLAVTVQMNAPLPKGPLHARPFWQFAVRPNTPQQVYPQRYLEAPQLSDGPRRWLCDLAVIGAAQRERKGTVLADCRIPFVPLTGNASQTCGCGITLGPDEVIASGGLQAVADALASKHQSLNLLPGSYLLDAPLTLTAAHNGFTLAGCGAGVQLSANPNSIAAFSAGQGLINVVEAVNVTLRDLSLTLPVQTVMPAAPPAGQGGGQEAQPTLATLVGVLVDEVLDVTISDCQFDFVLPQLGAAGDAQLTLGAGIFAPNGCGGLKVVDNDFKCSTLGISSPTHARLLCAIWITPPAGASGEPAANANGDTNSTAITVDNLTVNGNSFTGMTIAALVVAQLGFIRCNNNRAWNCCGGFLFVESDIGSNTAMLRAALDVEQQTPAQAGVASLLRQAVQPTLLANAVQYATKLRAAAAVKPAEPSAATGAAVGMSKEARRVLVADYTTRGSAAYATLVKQAAALGNQQGAAPVLDDETYKANVVALDTLQNIGVQAELYIEAIEPDIALRNNDLALVAPIDSADHTSTGGVLGLLVLLQQGGDTGTVFVSGNRVDVPNTSSIALSALWAVDTLVTGNLFNQVGAQNAYGAVASTGLPCALLVADAADELMVMANIMHLGLFVAPARAVPPGVQTTSWDFMNTTG
ncbi:DUF6519 domain-containing protein [Paraburkholderia sp. MM5482-R1]|uniref:DUF6519 domain-containing protein n=1 Tax=unclassified Paraburkholderia TaxID=2615204 RepID=UPI003D22D756